jgi:hypothetical protein
VRGANTILQHFRVHQNSDPECLVMAAENPSDESIEFHLIFEKLLHDFKACGCRTRPERPRNGKDAQDHLCFASLGFVLYRSSPWYDHSPFPLLA